MLLIVAVVVSAACAESPRYTAEVDYTAEVLEFQLVKPTRGGCLVRVRLRDDGATHAAYIASGLCNAAEELRGKVVK
jgi:hypothetical protein